MNQNNVQDVSSLKLETQDTCQGPPIPEDVFQEAKIWDHLVKFKVLKLVTKTGVKKSVRAFFVNFRGQPQIHFKYGKLFYVFNLEEATLNQADYNRFHNIRK